MMAQDKTESWLTYVGQVAHLGADYSKYELGVGEKDFSTFIVTKLLRDF